MRIFCCSNTPGGGGTERLKVFQSAMRIFCCSNYDADPRAAFFRDVSIRDADFLLFEPLQQPVLQPTFLVSIRDADFLLFEPAKTATEPAFGTLVSIRDADFLLFERNRSWSPSWAWWVSIRDADFLLFERQQHLAKKSQNKSFQSAMRIFCCSNRVEKTERWTSYCFNPRCGFFAVRTLVDLEGKRRKIPCFNPRCGFFAVRTIVHKTHSSSFFGFQSAMRIFCCSNCSRTTWRSLA